MMGTEVWRERTLALTFVLLTASALLIPPGVLGIGASIPVLAVLFGTGLVLAALRDTLAGLPRVLGYDLGTYLREIWLGPFVAVALVLLVAPSASPGELQSIGGVAGLAGMANYFVRPLYFLVYGLVRRFLPAESRSRE